MSECEAATCAQMGVNIDIGDEKHVLSTGVSHAEQSPVSDGMKWLGKLQFLGVSSS